MSLGLIGELEITAVIESRYAVGGRAVVGRGHKYIQRDRAGESLYAESFLRFCNSC